MASQVLGLQQKLPQLVPLSFLTLKLLTVKVVTVHGVLLAQCWKEGHCLFAVLNSQIHCGSYRTLRSSKRFQDLGGGSERKETENIPYQAMQEKKCKKEKKKKIHKAKL